MTPLLCENTTADGLPWCSYAIGRLLGGRQDNRLLRGRHVSCYSVFVR